ncbi:MAG: DUF262 domain-containing protein [Acidimicrobiaceae bacterium]|nr:DUF262 domain-containing protein [Acidimicrobiaceae bacterium]MYF42022.1 DUF262 domain-containing protein [Acidimicrobiaceae bacterium]
MGQQDLRVHELVSKIERGEIRLPEMQRKFVWTSPRVRDLLDSLYRGYPSGTILTWDTDEQVATRDFAIEQASPTQDRFQLLLDGQQRLTALSAVLRGERIEVRWRKRPIDVLFNLEHPEDLQIITEVHEHGGAHDSDAEEIAEASEDELQQRFEQMAFVVSSRKLASLPHWVSVTEVFKEASDAPFLKRAGVTSMDDPRYDKYTSRLRRLRDIRNYEYRVTVLDRDKSYEEVTEIFVRVNSLGAKLRSADLALAQITAKWRNSLEVFQEFESECADSGFHVELPIHLKNLVAFATGQSRFRIVSSLDAPALQEAWKDAKDGMRFALNFLRSNAAIDSPALWSSPFLLIAVAFFGHRSNYKLSADEAHQLRYWVLNANAKARYSRGSSETFLDQDLASIRRHGDVAPLVQLLRTQVGRLEVLPSDLESRTSRSAYFKTMFIAFRRDEATDWQDQLIISLKHKGSQHSLQFHHIFPQSVLKERGMSPSKINDVCNLSFISGSTNRSISRREPAEYLPKIVSKIGEEALIRQCIPLNPDLWTLDTYEDFLDERRQLVARRLNEFLGHGQ